MFQTAWKPTRCYYWPGFNFSSFRTKYVQDLRCFCLWWEFVYIFVGRCPNSCFTIFYAQFGEQCVLTVFWCSWQFCQSVQIMLFFPWKLTADYTKQYNIFDRWIVCCKEIQQFCSRITIRPDTQTNIISFKVSTILHSWKWGHKRTFKVHAKNSLN